TPSAVTTTSFKDMISGYNTTSMTERPATGISSDKYPTEEKSSTASSLGTSNEYLPFMSVMVPVVVPFTTTVTPGKALPFSSVILPETLIACKGSVENA